MDEKITQTEIVKEDSSQQPPVVSKKAAKYSVYDQTIYLVFGIIEGVLGLRFVFRLLGANPSAPIVRLMQNISDVLMAPFRFILPTGQVEGAVFEWSVLAAILLYIFFPWILTRIIRILYTKDIAE